MYLAKSLGPLHLAVAIGIFFEILVRVYPFLSLNRVYQVIIPFNQALLAYHNINFANPKKFFHHLEIIVRGYFQFTINNIILDYAFERQIRAYKFQGMCEILFFPTIYLVLDLLKDKPNFLKFYVFMQVPISAVRGIDVCGGYTGRIYRLWKVYGLAGWKEMLLSGYLHCMLFFLTIGTLSPFVLSVYDLIMLRVLVNLKKNLRYFLTKPLLWMIIIGQAMHVNYPMSLNEKEDWLVRSIFIISTHTLTVIHFSTQAFNLLYEMIEKAGEKKPVRKKSSKKLT